MIDKLEFFIALANERHFGRAAEECGITQPTLSAAIRQLEDQLGVMLVSRGSRFQGLTPEGQRVLEWARRIVGDARTMREEMRAARKGLSGHIRLAVIPTALAMVPKITAPFQERHPDVTFSVISRNSLQVLGMLENLEIDAGITYLENEPLGRVTSVPLYAERYHLITAAGSPLSDRKERHLEGGGRPSALSIDRRHAEPPDHQPASCRGRRDGQADARIQLDDRAVFPCAHRPLGQHHAEECRQILRFSRGDPDDSDRRAVCPPSGRPGRHPSRTVHPARLGACCTRQEFSQQDEDD